MELYSTKIVYSAKCFFYANKGTSKGERKNDNRDNIPLAINSPASGEGT